jgi:anti-sigma factor RsiW
MKGPCPQRQDQIADYVIGALDSGQADALREHLASCAACRRYAQSLDQETKSLVALGRQIDAGTQMRQDRVIAALQDLSPAEADRRHVFPFVGGFGRMAIAAVLVLGAGIGIGRWTAPRVDVKQLRADLQASVINSIRPTVQEAVLAHVDRRVAAGWATKEADLRAELGDQLRGDLQLFATQFTAGVDREMKKRFAGLVQSIEEVRVIDHQRVKEAFEQIDKNHKTQMGQGFQSLVALAAKTTPATQH